MKKKIADFLTRVRIWVRWKVIVVYEKEYRYGSIVFSKRFNRQKRSHELFISEAEYLYDEPAAILRAYRDYVVPNEEARKDIRK